MFFSVLTGNEVHRNSTTLRVNYCPSLEWLVTGNRVGVRRDSDGNLRFLLNGEDMGVAATNLPEVKSYVMMQLLNLLSIM
jgi:neuralized-like protein 4